MADDTKGDSLLMVSGSDQVSRNSLMGNLGFMWSIQGSGY